MGPSLFLFAVEGKKIRPVLEDLPMSYSFVTRGDTCVPTGEFQAKSAVLGVAPAEEGDGPFPDLVVTGSVYREIYKVALAGTASYPQRRKLPAAADLHYRLRYARGHYDLDAWNRYLGRFYRTR